MKTMYVTPILLSAMIVMAACTPGVPVIEEENSGIVTTSSLPSSTDESNSSPTEKAMEGVMYRGFSETEYTALLGKEPFVLFFHASWCPTCIQLEKKINEEVAATAPALPGGMPILKANYDTEVQLKRKYGITMQSSLVFIDAAGNKSAVLIDPTIEELSAAMSSLL